MIAKQSLSSWNSVGLLCRSAPRNDRMICNVIFETLYWSYLILSVLKLSRAKSSPRIQKRITILDSLHPFSSK